jgi:hypothetical protein
MMSLVARVVSTYRNVCSTVRHRRTARVRMSSIASWGDYGWGRHKEWCQDNCSGRWKLNGGDYTKVEGGTLNLCTDFSFEIEAEAVAFSAMFGEPIDAD